MSHLSTALLPHLTIRRVVISESDVEIEAFLTTHQESEDNFWINEEYFSDYIKIYFILIHDGDDLGTTLAAPGSRVANTRQLFGMDSTRLDWDTELLNKYAHKNITLSQVIKSDFNNLTKISTLDRNSGELSDMCFSVKVEYANKFPITTNSLTVPDLKLHAFAHLDVLGLVNDFNLSDDPVSISEMLKLGGNFKNEQLLIATDNGLRVPETHDILTYDDGTPYNGIFHYHDGDGPGTPPYTGYMEGPRTPMHPDARKLFLKSVPYRKVVANFLLEDFEFGGLSTGAFFGSTELDQSLQSNYLTPYEESRNMFLQIYENTNLYSAGQGPLTGRLSQPISSMKASNLGAIFDPQSINAIREAHFKKLSEIKDFSIIFNSIDYIDTLEESDINHTVLFNIDYEKLVRSKSKYAFLIDNMARMDSPNNFAAGLRSVLDSVAIRKFSIKRHRVSNNPRSNNPVSTADYDIYSNNTLKRFLVSTQKGDSDVLRPARSKTGSDLNRRLLASIEEMPRDQAGDRMFKLKDYELARDINFGNYAYTLEIHLEDNINSRIISLIESLSKGVIKLKEFLSLVLVGEEVPLNAGERSRTQSTFERTYLRGRLNIARNYDFQIQKYSNDFVNLFRAEYQASFNTVIQDFLKSQILLGSMPSIALNDLQSSIFASVSPTAAGQPEYVDFLIALIQNAVQNLNNMLSVSPDSSLVGSTSTKANTASSVSATVGHRSNIIIFEKRIPGVVRSFQQGEVLVSYGLSNLDSFANRAGQMRTPLNREDFEGPDIGIDINENSLSDTLYGLPPDEVLTWFDTGMQSIITLEELQQLPDDARQTVDTNIIEMINTIPEETIGQIDRGITQFPTGHSSGPGLDIDFGPNPPRPTPADINIDIATNPLGDFSTGLSAGNIGSIQAGLKGYEDINLETEVEQITELNNFSAGTVPNLEGDLRGLITSISQDPNTTTGDMKNPLGEMGTLYEVDGKSTTAKLVEVKATTAGIGADSASSKIVVVKSSNSSGYREANNVKVTAGTTSTPMADGYSMPQNQRAPAASTANVAAPAVRQTTTAATMTNNIQTSNLNFGTGYNY